ncbi:MAG: hypothetical protein IK000_07240 [Bacteroidaceae bacterium]|nr:hypothetical protein [Bacteroidaceae bacterium]
MDKFFLCLANSFKRGGRCIAGVEMVPDGTGKWKPVCNDEGIPKWIRPIASTTYGEIPNNIAESIDMFSIIRISDVVPCPDKAHTENVYYSRMEKCYYDISQEPYMLKLLIDPKHKSIFFNKGRAVSADMLMKINYSLMLIHSDKASAYIDENRENSRNRMKFSYYGTEYDFPITDPEFIDELRKNPNKYTRINDVYLTLSLGLVFEGWHHKLVAGVIIPSDSLQTNKSYMDQQKQIYHNAYEKWTLDDDNHLKNLYKEGASIQYLSQVFGRNEGAIKSRLKKIGIESDIISSHNFDKETKHPSVSQQTHLSWFDEYERDLARLLDKKSELEDQIDDIRTKILQQMEYYGLDKINSEQFLVSYTPAKMVMQFDSGAFRKENKELYSNYCKPKQRESHIVIKRNDKE